MTANTATLAVRIDVSQAGSAATALDRFQKSGAGAETSAARLTTAASALRNVFAGLSAAVVVRNFVQLADTYTNINSRLKLVTQSAGEYVSTQQALFDISQRTRVALEQTADLYGSLSRSTDALGVSQSDVLGVTETINKALIISGTSAQGASAALVQLGQGFAAGALRGEELNSVLEQAPRLAKAIADGLGVTVGQLRELGQQGALTGEKVFAALQKSGATIQKEFGAMALTVDQASTQSANALLKLVGTVDETTGASAALARSISASAVSFGELADEISRGAAGSKDIGALAEAFLVVEETVKVLGANVKFVFQGVGREIGAVFAQAEALSRLDFRGFTAIGDAVKADAAEARRALDQYEREVLSRTRRPAASATATPSTAARPAVTTRGSATAPRASSDSAQREAQALVDEWSPLRLRWELDASGQDFSTDAEDRLDALIGKYRDLADPAAKYREEVQLVTALEAQGKLSAEEAFAARTRIYDEMDQSTRRLNEGLREQTSVADSLGLTFSSAFEDAIVSGRKLSEVLEGLAQDVARIAIRKSITEPLGEALGAFINGGLGGGKGGKGGGIFSAITSFLGFADGGYIRGPGNSTSDSIPARLSNGEYVVRASAVKQIGVGALDAINSGRAPQRFNQGGFVGTASPGSMRVQIINNTPAQVTTRQTGDGGLQVLIESLESELASRASNGVGALNSAFQGRYGLKPSMGY